jgi:hypothetical protein
LQAVFNNALSRPISYSPNKVMQGLKANTSLSLLALDNNRIPEVIRNLRYINTELAIKFAANMAKKYYNSRHTPIKLNVSNIIYLKLYKGY